MLAEKIGATVLEQSEQILVVTGRLAEAAVRETVRQLEPTSGSPIQVVVLGINVAALMHVKWVARKLEVPAGITRVILPGWCQGDLSLLDAQFGVPFELGPKNIRDLPRHLRQGPSEPPDLTAYDIEIIAEINHAPRLSDEALLSEAESMRADGADRIDYGCIAGEGSAVTGHHVGLLVEHGFRVSVDSFDQAEVTAAVSAGADLVLSCNSTNVKWLKQLDVDVVVVPDDFNNLDTLIPTIAELTAAGRRFRLDPILEPIGFGFFRSLQRYAETRRRWPDASIMMGVGNVSELSEVDSAGVNFLLAAICQELQIDSVLTTQVINWARSSVRELDVSRRLLKYAIDHEQIPKHLDSSLVRLRDAQLFGQSAEELKTLAAQLKDPNFRIFAEADGLHLMNRTGHWHGEDPYELVRQAMQVNDLEASHAFYLGYEMALAETARQLGKQYTQDEPLNWGDLTQAKRVSLRGRPSETKPPDAESTTVDSRDTQSFAETDEKTAQ